MQVFDSRFVVSASLEAVSAFHFQPGILKVLTPPLMIMQVHRFEPLAEGSIAEFTMWMGPLPVYWRAVHSNVSPDGFTDTQVAGPMKFWQHTHRFSRIDDHHTEVHDHIEFEHWPGRRGLRSHLLFPQIGLKSLFMIRGYITKREIRKSAQLIQTTPTGKVSDRLS